MHAQQPPPSTPPSTSHGLPLEEPVLELEVPLLDVVVELVELDEEPVGATQTFCALSHVAPVANWAQSPSTWHCVLLVWTMSEHE
jgi:hypothetical protein